MTARWPSCARSTPEAPDTIVFLRSLPPTLRCRAHEDGSVQTLSLAAGAPGEEGNGHPLEASATYWGRCPTCSRLHLVVPATQSHRRVEEYTEG